ncbi:uncharacterized protein TNIN_246411 [Trichonephila inaurata madagascariensis]|uniref:BTB domain-containing protein n=1 Tax=Trichonephila inaurata madagascariensis TaxID=2747483 RepID=A0A8X7CSR7_9ARAC|nr:uncharacterized protein TNIN_246411 [Trichonephila inaurata madagascariensis]
MPHPIAVAERYMHDTTDAVLKKYSMATKFQKTAKFTGGIWDVSEVDMVPPSNKQDPVDFLLNLISTGDDGSAQEMEEGENDSVDGSVVNPLHETSKIFYPENESVTKNKRGLRDELDDKTLFISEKETGIEMSRKRTKKTVLFSNSPVKNETSETKQSNLTSKLLVELTSTINESFDMKDARNILEIEDKRSSKVEDQMNLTLQSDVREPVTPTKDPLLHVKVDKSLKRSQITPKENVNVEVKKKNHVSGQEKMNLLSVRENFSAEKHLFIEKPMSLDEAKCSKSEMKNKMKNKVPDSDILKNIEELLGDGDFLTKEQIKSSSKSTKLVKRNAMSKMISVPKNKDRLKNSLKDPMMKPGKLPEVFMPEEEYCYDEWTEDESQIRKLKRHKEKTGSPSQSISEIPSVLDDVAKPKEKVETVQIVKEASVSFSSDKMTLTLNDKHSNNSFTNHKNHSASFNWRDDCINVRQSTSKVNKNGLKPSDSFNWRDHCIGSKISEKEHEKDFSTAFNLRRKDGYGELNVFKEYLDLDETKEDMETLSNEKLKKRLLKINQKVKEPDPLSRFQGIGNPDPESIWNLPEESKISSQYQKNSGQNDSSKTNVKMEEIHTQSREIKKVKIPNFFGTPTKTFSKQSLKTDEENLKIPQKKESEATSRNLERSSYGSRSSRSHKENHVSSNSYGRSRSLSVNWRNTLHSNNYSDYNDSKIIITVTNKEDHVVEELMVRENELFEVKKEIQKLFHLVPDPDELERPVNHSAPAVKVFLRCLFSSSYTLPDWKVALEVYAIAKKFNVDHLRNNCQDYFESKNLSLKDVGKIAEVAKYFNVIEALRSSKIFPEVQRAAKSLVNSSSRNESCVVSCTTFMEPSEFCIPLHYENDRGIAGTNYCDLNNTVILKCISGVLRVNGIQLKLQAQGVFSKSKEMFVYCEVDGREVFNKDISRKIHMPLLIPFEKGLILKAGDEKKINVLIDDISLRMCSQVQDEELLFHGKFHASFKSGKTSNNKKPLFFIEKIIYTFKSSRK